MRTRFDLTKTRGGDFGGRRAAPSRGREPGAGGRIARARPGGPPTDPDGHPAVAPVIRRKGGAEPGKSHRHAGIGTGFIFGAIYFVFGTKFFLARRASQSAVTAHVCIARVCDKNISPNLQSNTIELAIEMWMCRSKRK